MIRVVGGSLRGRRLSVPAGVRPTTDRARQAIFDVLGPAVGGARVLDAAAGSGALGIEALSRGAREAVFVEESARAARGIAENLARLGLEDRSNVVRSTVSAFASGEGARSRFDLVFHDPPWRAGRDADVAALHGLLAEGGTLVHERGDETSPWPEGPAPSSERRYGETRFFVYRR